MGDLTAHFDLAEFLVNGSNLPNSPDPASVANLAFGCRAVLEPLRVTVGPITITSGYRSPGVQADLKARGYNPSSTSDHLVGRAADIQVADRPQAWAALVQMVVDGDLPDLDQAIIYEDQGHIHIGWGVAKRQSLLVHLADPEADPRYTSWHGYTGALAMAPHPPPEPPGGDPPTSPEGIMATLNPDIYLDPQVIDLVGKKLRAKRGGGQKLTWKKVTRVIEDAVRIAEDVVGAGNGAEKKAMAISIINEAIDLPIIGEGIEAVLFGLLVDLISNVVTKG